MIAEHPVKTEFTYWTRPEPPDPFEAYHIINGDHPGIQRYPIEVQDIRKSPIRFNLNDHAFQVIKHTSSLLPPSRTDFNFGDPQQVRDEYWPEVRALLKSELGVRSVLLVENVARTSSNEQHVDPREKDGRMKETNGKRAPPAAGKPFHIVHNDFSPVGSRNLLRAIKPSFYEENGSASVPIDEQKEFFKLREDILRAEQSAIEKSGQTDHTKWDGANYQGPRWAHFSIWRPLDTVERDPLGLLDPTSIFTVPSSYAEKRKAYVSIPFPHRDRRGLLDYEGTNIMPAPPQLERPHRWYWTQKQQPNEVYAIKFFDSEAWKEGSHVMPCAAHSAFRLPEQSDQPPRRSSETRCLVIW